MVGKWSVRPYNEGDERRINELHRKVFDHVEEDGKWYPWWTWQHKKNPSGPPMIWFADADGTLAGQYEVVRIRVRYKGKEMMACHSQDTMTHPDFRRQGIFETLANRTYQQGAEEDVAFVIGFPNQNSHPGFVNKLRWFDVCKVPNVFKPFNIKRTLGRRIKNGALLSVMTAMGTVFFSLYHKDPRPKEVKGLRIVEVRSFDERMDDLWKKASPHYGTLVVRDRAHLNWRYVEIPHRDYSLYIAEIGGRVAGYIVLTTIVKDGWKGGEIVDLFAEPDGDIIGNLIHAAMEHIRKEGADSVHCWLPDMKVYRKSFRRFGFVHMAANPQFIARTITSAAQKEHMIDYGKWFITMGDSDFH